MKVSLVVASGVHQGRVIPVPGAQFLIGRDPQCQLRPASQAISKQHCAILVRDGRVFLKDFGSTNGTLLNDQQVAANAEVEVKAGDRLKLGPLDFTIQLVQAKPSDSTPLPDSLQPLGAAAAKPPSTPGAKPVAKAPEPIPGPKPSGDDDAAAMLLGMGEDDPSPSDVPGGSTVMDLTLPTAGGPPADDKKDKKAAIPTKEDTSSAASEILRRYMRRPR
jgi:predicted component of type VI protein secretion system